MKVEFVKARGNFSAGQVVDLPNEEYAKAVASGDALDAVSAAEAKKLREDKSKVLDANISQAIVRAKKRGAIAPKDEVKATEAVSRFKQFRGKDNEVDGANLIVETLDAMEGEDQRRLTERTTVFARENGGAAPVLGYGAYTGESLKDNLLNGYCKAREDMNNVIRTLPAGDEGKSRLAGMIEVSRSTSAVLASTMHAIEKLGGDVRLMDVIHAADTTDANVGTVNTGLVLMRNLGFLKNKLGWMPYISTDLRNEPALFNQNIFTRYIVPPATVAFDTTNGWVTQTPTATDVNVSINQHYGVPITFQTQLLGSTVRNLFAEQQGAQIYALAEKVNTNFLTTLFAAAWTGTIATNSQPLANWNITGLVGIKNALTISKVPDIGRFVLLHSMHHDKLLQDSNLILANTLMAALGGNGGQAAASYNTGELPVLFGLKVLESQLALATTGVLGSVTVTNGVPSYGANNQVGFAGNMSSMLFAARIPQDYTTVLPGIPATAAIEIITDPDSGLSMMFTKYIDHKLAATVARVSLMWGTAQGDPRQGIVITP